MQQQLSETNTPQQSMNAQNVRDPEGWKDMFEPSDDGRTMRERHRKLEDVSMPDR